MIKNYLKIVWRILLQEKIHSLIKIGGFAVGIAACLLITLFIVDEYRYDKQFQDGDRILRVLTEKKKEVIAW